jgi:hypothetical protein
VAPSDHDAIPESYDGSSSTSLEKRARLQTSTMTKKLGEGAVEEASAKIENENKRPDRLGSRRESVDQKSFRDSWKPMLLSMLLCF